MKPTNYLKVMVKMTNPLFECWQFCSVLLEHDKKDKRDKYYPEFKKYVPAFGLFFSTVELQFVCVGKDFYMIKTYSILLIYLTE